jgi:hypothetical protein
MNVHAPTKKRVRAGREASRLVYICANFPKGLSPRSYQKLIMRRPELRGLGWTLQRRAVREDGLVTRPPQETPTSPRDAGLNTVSRA